MLGKGKIIMKQYIIISGLNLTSENRGTAALGYGAFTFLKEKGLMPAHPNVLTIRYSRSGLKTIIQSREIDIQGIKVQHTEAEVSIYEKYFFQVFGFLLPFGALKELINNTEYVAAINGGDGFSDIYGTRIFRNRLPDTMLAMYKKIPLYILPQTLGPFNKKRNKKLASRILHYATSVYARDRKFCEELDRMRIKYEVLKDLSAFMKPEPIDISIDDDSVGINVSGLAYSNAYNSLAGRFENYPYLITQLITAFQSKGVHVYLIPHSYNVKTPAVNDDDFQACQTALSVLRNKDNVTFVDRDLISPQVKYVISKMKFFVGTRMHANFAAIYTNVPLFGLAYSYKFEGAFRENGVYDDNVAMVTDITKEECDSIVNRIINRYLTVCK